LVAGIAYTGISLYGGTGGIDTFAVYNASDSINGAGSAAGSIVLTSLSSFDLNSKVTGVYNLTDTLGSGVTLTGSSLGAGTITGGTGADSIRDGGLIGVTGDTLVGGGGKDTFVVANINDSISGSSTSLIQTNLLSFNFNTSSFHTNVYNLTDTLASGVTLTGSSLGAGTITGGTGADSISDGGLTSTLGATIVGGGGADTFVVSNAKDKISGGSGSVIQTTVASFNLGSSLVSGVYNLLGLSTLTGTLTGSSLSAGTIQGAASGVTLNDGGVAGSLGDTLIASGNTATFIVSNAKDVISLAGTGSSIISSGSYNLGSSNIQAGDINLLTYSGSGAAVLTGNNNADTINASLANGDVTISGQGYGSSIVGGQGTTTIYGYGGSTLRGQGDHNTFIVNTADDFIYVSNAGFGNTSVIQTTLTNFNLGASTGSGVVSGVNYLLYTGISAATLTGNGNLYESLNGSSSSLGVSISGAGLFSTLVGGSGNDCLLGNAYNSLYGGTGFDALVSQNGVSTLNGAGGTDTFIVGTTTDTIIGNSLSGSLGSVVQTTATNFNLGSSRVSGVANLVFTADAAATLTGSSLSGSIIGNVASVENETLSDGGSGQAIDTLIGGGGSNTYLVSNPNDYIQDAGTNSILITPFSTNLASATRISRINNVEFTGTGGALSGNNNGDSLIADGGNNTLYGAWNGSGKASTLIGGGLNNTYVIVYNWDTIIDTGSGGVINAPGSYDLNSSLVSGVNNLVHSGSKYVAKLVGNSNAGSLIANASNDTLVGGGQNTMIGASAHNTYTYIVNSSTDTILDSGTNSVIRSAGEYDLSSSLAGGVNTLVHTGASGVSLTANNGACSIFSGYANDTLIDGGGACTLNGYGGTNTYIVSNANDRIIDAGKASQILTSLSTYNLASSLISGVSNLVFTGLGDASLSGNTLANSIVGGSGNDTLSNGGGGTDTLVGGTGANTYIISSARDSITDSGSESIIRSAVGLNLGSSLISGVSNLVYTGTAGASLAGSSNSDSIVGGSGNDTLSDGGGGSDTLVGGAGANTYIVTSTNDLVMDSGSGSVIRSTVGFNLGSSLISGVNKLVYTVSAGASLIGSSSSDSIVGGSGNDTLSDGGGGSDTLVGGGGANTYFVSSAMDKITDTGLGSVINTALSSFNLGSSLISGVNNLVYTGSGNTTLFGNSKANILDASAASSGISLSGGAGKDTLLGGSGNDTLIGNGASSLVGGAGANTYVVSSAADSINDTGSGGVIRSSVGFSLGSSLVSGVNNLVYTGSGNVSLVGNSSANSITGSAGKDTIQGWFGTAASNTASDTLSGGAGSDSFILSTAGQTNNAYGNGTGAVAKITDFQGGSTGDKLVLHNFGTVHAGSSGYQTLSGGSGVLDVYSYQGTDSNQLVAHLTLASGTFSWSANTSFV
jgi:Ca2+-binding RTX toxin-like protein